MRNFLFMFLVVMFLIKPVSAGEIPDVTETLVSNTKHLDTSEIIYPVRNNALVIILQPCPDNSGDFMFTVCNKKSHCYQTSMRNDEVRYIGLFLEDFGQNILSNLNKGTTKEEWAEVQRLFRTLYADYMNRYDEVFGALKSLKEVTPNKK